MVLSTATIFWYYAYFLKIDDEEYDGHTALLQEGLFASFTLFLVSLFSFLIYQYILFKLIIKIEVLILFSIYTAFLDSRIQLDPLLMFFTYVNYDFQDIKLFIKFFN